MAVGADALAVEVGVFDVFGVPAGGECVGVAEGVVGLFGGPGAAWVLELADPVSAEDVEGDAFREAAAGA
ncbi:MAG: hypothetical protein AAF547_06420 [Actinomycetota bacterium]